MKKKDDELTWTQLFNQVAEDLWKCPLLKGKTELRFLSNDFFVLMSKRKANDIVEYFQVEHENLENIMSDHKFGWTYVIEPDENGGDPYVFLVFAISNCSTLEFKAFFKNCNVILTNNIDDVMQFTIKSKTTKMLVCDCKTSMIRFN